MCVFLLVVVDWSEAKADPLAVLQQRNTETVAVPAHKEGGIEKLVLVTQ